MTRHHKFLGSDAQPVEAVILTQSEVQSVINPSVEENTMSVDNINAAENNTAPVNEEVILENPEQLVEEEMTLEEAAVVGRKFRKGSVLWAGGVSGFISAVACLAARSFHEEVKLTNKDILVRTAVNTAAAAGLQATAQIASKRLNDSHTGSYVAAHLVGCVTPVVGMRVMVANGIGADGYKEAGTVETAMLAGVDGLPLTVDVEAPVEAVL